MPRQTTKAKQDVIKLHQENLSLSQISKKLNIPKTTCFNFIRRFEARDHPNNKKNPGRPKQMDKREERRLIRTSVNDPQKNTTQLLSHLQPEKGCLTSLIRKILISYGLRARNAMKKNTFDSNESPFQKRVGNQPSP